jgi:hypothetical protein
VLLDRSQHCLKNRKLRGRAYPLPGVICGPEVWDVREEATPTSHSMHVRITRLIGIPQMQASTSWALGAWFSDCACHEAQPAWRRESGPAAYAEGPSMRPPPSEAFSVPRRTPFGEGEHVLCNEALTVDGSPWLEQPGDRALNHGDERRWIDA